MTTQGGADLTDLIAGGEGGTTEFKRSLTKDIGRELCAFANGSGGTVLVGVTDAGKIVGVVDHNRLRSRVQSTARSADPPIEVDVESIGEILRVVVPPQKRKPYSFGGRFFMRDGPSSQQMSNAEVEELFYAAGRLHFDRKPCAEFSIENDLDEETWKRFSSRAKIPEAMDRMVALRNLGLLVGLPAGMTEADLGTKSMPRNPLLFGMLYRMDAVENIGSGIKRIRDLCREHGVAAPIIDVSEHWVTVTFHRPAAQGDEGTGADGRSSTSDGAREMQVSVREAQEAQEAQDGGREAQDGAQEAQDGGDRTDSNGERLQDWEIAVLSACAERPATGRELLAASGYATRTGNFKKGVERLVAMDLLELTIPDKPRSGRQRYRLTAAGRRRLAGLADVKK